MGQSPRILEKSKIIEYVIRYLASYPSKNRNEEIEKVAEEMQKLGIRF